VSADKGIMEREVSTLIPPLRLGNLLREAREAAGLELDDLIAHSVLTVVDLDDLEHGRRLINDQLLGELMNLYGIDDATLAPERSRLIIDLDEGLISVAHSDISIGEATGADAILSRYLALVYRMRELPIGSPIGLRDIDLGVLSTALELDASDIEVRLERLIADEDGIERVQVRLRRRLLVPAAGIVIAATSAGVLILIAESETTPEGVSSITASAVETNLGNGAAVAIAPMVETNLGNGAAVAIAPMVETDLGNGAAVAIAPMVETDLGNGAVVVENTGSG
jgi:transcriptional regulator with XRE-family HTH domain